MRISACMIAKNEEKNIARCINSYKSIVDEIVVIDTGSTDRTIEIAQDLGAVVYNYRWNNDFAAAKNYALSKVNGDWAIVLDADEYFEQAQVGMLRSYLQKLLKKNIHAVACKMHNIDADGRILNTIVQVRILRNNGRICYKNRIHEELSVNSGNLTVSLLEPKQLIIYHTGYAAAISKDKAKRNLSLLLEELEQTPNPRLYHYLSDAYLILEQYEECRKYAQLVIDACVSIPGYDSKAYQNIVHSMVNLGYSIEDINFFIEKCIVKFPEHPVFYVYMARSKVNSQEYTKALENYERALKLQHKYNDIEINFVSSILHEIYFNIGWLYELKNDHSNALTNFVNALKQNKYYSEAFLALIQLIKRFNDEDIIALLSSIYDKTNFNDVKFLVDQLSKVKLGKVLFYYTNIWLNDFKKNDTALLFAFLANKKYERAFELFSNCYFAKKEDWSELFSVTAALLSKNDSNIALIKEYVNSSYKKILEGLSNLDNKRIFNSDDAEYYAALLKELIFIGDSELVKRYLDLQNNFDINIRGLIGNVLFEQREFSKAINQYKDYLQTNNEMEQFVKAEYYFNIAYCHYKLHQFEKAEQCFKKASELGYNKNNLHEFLLFIKNKVEK